MSYILDALRKADSERERGTVPSIHAQPVPLTSDEEASGRLGTVPPVWIVAGLSVGVIGVLSWMLLGREPSTSGADQVAGLTPHAVSVAPPTQPMQQSTRDLAEPPVELRMAPPPQPIVPAVRQAVPSIPPVPTVPPAATRPPVPPPVISAAPARVADKARSPDGQAPVADSAAAAAGSSSAQRIYAISELPEDVRRALPTLVFGGAMYSDNPASRMLIISGHVFHQGDSITPEVSVEEIRLKTAVLRYRDYRYSVTF